jgi:N utilization substance protein B
VALKRCDLPLCGVAATPCPWNRRIRHAQTLSEVNDDDKKFASDLMQTILTNEQSYLDKLQQLSNGYDVGRIYRVDKCALVIAMAEFDCCPQTPVAVIVDEYVNLVAKYSTENSTNFVNGILAEYVKEKTNG